MIEINNSVLDIEDEEELLMRLENQLQNIGNDFLEIDYLNFYARNMMGFPDYEPMNKFELYIPEDKRTLHAEMMMSFKIKFLNYLGINLFNSNDTDTEFETLYNIYYMFVLDIHNTLAKYMLALPTDFNEFDKDKHIFTLQHVAGELMKVNEINQVFSEENYDPEKITKILKKEAFSTESKENRNAYEELFKSSYTFKALYRKIFFTEQFFFERDDLLHQLTYLVYAIDNNEIYDNVMKNAYSYEFSLNIDIFSKKYELFLLNESNIDRIENIYKNKGPILLKNS